MSLTLAVAATIAGTIFTCQADTVYLTVFAPSEEVTAAHRGNVLTLYKVNGDGEILAADRKIDQVFDSLPTSLYIKLAATEFDVELDISDLDEDSGKSAISIKGSAKDGQVMEITGTCLMVTSDGDDGQ